MQDSLSRHISVLKSAPGIQGNVLLAKRISDIDKYFDDEATQAYLLGQLLRDSDYNVVRSSDNNVAWSSDDFKRMLQYLEEKKLASYFEGRTAMPRSGDEIKSWAIFVFAILSILLGTVRLLTNSVALGLNRYNLLVVIEGGFPLIAGLLLLIPAFSLRKHARRRKQLLLQVTEIS
jgi:hypothetical protein